MFRRFPPFSQYHGLSNDLGDINRSKHQVLQIILHLKKAQSKTSRIRLFCPRSHIAGDFISTLNLVDIV